MTLIFIDKKVVPNDNHSFELSDAIYVVDIHGYIGNQVSKEIEFAKSKGKEIILHSEYSIE
ncbi:MAG: hypothetical protein ACI4S2_07125 [Lachnospiraceae bacterium]